MEVAQKVDVPGFSKFFFSPVFHVDNILIFSYRREKNCRKYYRR